MEALKKEGVYAELEEILRVWPKVSKVLSTIHTEDQYNYAVQILDKLIDMVGEDENHPLSSLMETIGTLIENYEHDQFPEPEGNSIGSLKYLMEEHGLKQSDLNELGSQGVVSEILNGKRNLNLRQIRALSNRFKVSPSVFIDN